MINKKAIQAQIVEILLGCLSMTDDRNAVAHIYGEIGAKTIYKNIKKDYLKLIEGLYASIRQTS